MPRVGDRIWLALAMVFMLATHLAAQTLTLDPITIPNHDRVPMALRSIHDEAIFAYSASIAFDTAFLTFDSATVFDTADYIAIDDSTSYGWITIDVIVDTDASGPESIPAAVDHELAELSFGLDHLVDTTTTTAVSFVDGFGSPATDNRVVFAGATIGVGDGLTLIDGIVTIEPVAANRLTIADRGVVSLDEVAVPIRMTTPDVPVAALSIAIAHDPALLELSRIETYGTATAASGAEFVMSDLAPSAPVGMAGGTFVVILDFEAPFDAQAIPAGSDQAIARFVYLASIDLLAGEASMVSTSIDFVDGTLGDPPIDNELFVPGVPAAVMPELVSGALTIEPHAPPPPSTVGFYIGQSIVTVDGDGVPIAGDSPVTARGGTTELCFLYTSEQNLQGFQLAVCYDCELILSNFRVDDTIVGAVGAEYVNWQIDSDPFDGDACELIAGILLDALPPFDGQTVPQTATPLTIACVDVEVVDQPICAPIASNPASGIRFYCGPSGGLELDPDGQPTTGPIVGVAGESVDVCFYYTSEFSEIQGLQLAICFDCDLEFGDFDPTDGVPFALGADYINYSIDNDPDDGDGCEFVAGILMDLFPPFDGITLPTSEEPLLIGCVDATISPDAPCSRYLNIEFCDGVDGAGSVAIENIASVDYQSIQHFEKYCCAVFVKEGNGCECLEVRYCDWINGTGAVLIENIAVLDYGSYQNITKHPGYVCLTPRDDFFQRSDCNQDDKTDVSDAASILGLQFDGLDVGCLDACDANDDGRIDLADSVLVLNYVIGSGVIPAPFLECGSDPTPDELDCEIYTECND